jgi:phosphopantetheine adenylyltransferase
MPPSKVNPTNIYCFWQKINSLRIKIPQGRVKFKVGDLVMITKEKVKSAKGYEQNFSKKYSRLSRVFNARLNVFRKSQTCRLDLSKNSFTITSLSISLSTQTEFQIDKIQRTRKKDGINPIYINLIEWEEKNFYSNFKQYY